MMKDIAALGGELFVMDDGWFGDKYRRVQDNSSLGDWVVDRKKLPNGLENLIQTADRNGIKFGIWIEPEAVNSKSELFEKHPDWALQVKGRPLQYGRGGTQMLLDVCNPEVQDFMFGIVRQFARQASADCLYQMGCQCGVEKLWLDLFAPRQTVAHIH